MRFIKRGLIALLLAPVISWAQQSEDYQVVSMNEVPEHVVRTAQSAKPGIYVTRVVRQLDNDDMTFRFYASQVGRYWVIVVRDDGSLVDVYESPSAPPKLVKLAADD